MSGLKWNTFSRRGIVLRSVTGVTAAVVCAGMLLTQFGCPVPPAAQITVTISGDASVAVNQAANLTANVSGATGNLSFLWTIVSGGGFLANATLQSTAYTNTSATTAVVRVDVSDTGTGTSASAEFTITVGGAPGAAPTVDAGPAQTAVQGNTVNLTATVTGGTPPISFQWLQTSGGTAGSAVLSNTSSQTASATFSADAEGTFTFQVTVTDANGQQASDTTTVDVSASPAGQLTVDAGSLLPARSATGAAASGVVGTAGSNALTGTATQANVDPSNITVQWTSTSTPAGAGAVTFGNASSLNTSWNVAPPAVAGDYEFTLTATNTQSSQTASDTVTLQLLDAPTVVLKAGTSPTRLNLLRGGTGKTVELTYTSFSDGTISIFDGTTALGTAPPASDLVTTVPITNSNGAATDVMVTIAATGNDLQTRPPDTYRPTAQVTDIVGVVPGDGTANAQGLLTDTAVGAVASINTLIIHTGDSFNTTASTATPPVVQIAGANGEVGTPEGTGPTVNNVVHPGIGRTTAPASGGGIAGAGGAGAGSGVLDVNLLNGFMDFGDFNGDGLNDIVHVGAAGANQFEILLGRADNLSGGNAIPVGGNLAGATWRANDQVVTTAAIAAVAGGNYAVAGGVNDFCVGDLNGDSLPDIIMADYTAAGGAATDAIVAVINQGGATPFATVVARAYGPAVAGDFAAAAHQGVVECGDVTGDALADIVVGAPNAVSGGLAGRGALYMIKGVSSAANSPAIPASQNGGGGAGTGIEAAAVTGTVGAVINGVAISGAVNNTSLGLDVAIGNRDGGNNDVAVTTDLATTAGNGVRIYSGISGSLNNVPSASFVHSSAVEFATAASTFLRFGNVSGGANDDVLVSASTAANQVYVVRPTDASGLQLDGGSIITVTGLTNNANVAAIDVNGDGTNDLLIGDDLGGGADSIQVKFGPVTASYAANTGSDLTLQGNGADTTGFGVIDSQDVNGDNVADLVIQAATNVYVFSGLE